MCTIIGFSGRDCVSIILFQLYDSKTGFLGSTLFWAVQYDPLQPSEWKKV